MAICPGVHIVCHSRPQRPRWLAENYEKTFLRMLKYWDWLEVSILGADQKDRGPFGDENDCMSQRFSAWISFCLQPTFYLFQQKGRLTMHLSEIPYLLIKIDLPQCHITYNIDTRVWKGCLTLSNIFFFLSGLSGKSQILFALVFSTRYLDLFLTFISVYNTVMKIIYLVCAYGTVYLMLVKFKATYDSNHDTFRIEFLLIPVAGLACLVNHEFSVLEVGL